MLSMLAVVLSVVFLCVGFVRLPILYVSKEMAKYEEQAIRTRHLYIKLVLVCVCCLLSIALLSVLAVVNCDLLVDVGKGRVVEV